MTNQRVNWIDLHPQEDAEDVAAAIRRVVDRGWFVLGPEVEGFEAEFSDATSSQHTVSLASGTDALTLTLRALGIGPGDEVITTPLSAAFTALAIMMAGARPVFADIDPDRLTVDPAAVEALIGPSTAAIMPVHLYGQPADIRRSPGWRTSTGSPSLKTAARRTWRPARVSPSAPRVSPQHTVSTRRRTSGRSETAVPCARETRRSTPDCGDCVMGARPPGTTTRRWPPIRDSTRCRLRSCAPGSPT